MIAEAKVEMEKRGLTDADLKLIGLLSLPDKVITGILSMNPNTLRTKVCRLAYKMGVENRTALVTRALALKLITIKQLEFRTFDNGNYTTKNTS
ncbi:hypothetical protein LCGC14_2151370 [marine sediment metagenome]|uniref:HTH luxR-type domain-containing protein n=1 Tax=marine sediment metagenome TaxID=412755 RepID=A0A0F9G8J3_9ZZZZ